MSETSVLDYARYYNLATDARSQNLLGLIICGPMRDNGCPDQLRDPSCPDCDELLRDEKLQVSSEAVVLLTECMKPPPAPDWTSSLEDSRPAQRLKLETPMLISDHGRDMKWFKKGVDLRKLLQSCAKVCEPESSNVDGLRDVLGDCERFAISMNAELEDERPEATMAVMKSLSDSIHDAWKEQDLEDIVNQDLAFDKADWMHPLTPLLTPNLFSDDDFPCLPSIPQLDHEPRSEFSLEADDLLIQVERISKVEDQVCTSDVEARSPTRVRAILQDASIPTPIDPACIPFAQATVFESPAEGDRYLTANDLKVEVPMVLSPPESAQKPKISKHVAFKDIFEEFIDFSSQNENKDNAILKDEENDQKVLIQQLEQYEADVEEEIINAKPDANDKVLRVQVPMLEGLSIVDPRSTTTIASMIIQTVKDTGITVIQTKQADETKLNWIPIPQKLMQIDLNEEAKTLISIESFVERPDKILRSEQLLYKEPRLRVLDANDEDDEVMEEDVELTLNLTANTPGKTVPQKRQADDLTAPGFAVDQTAPHELYPRDMSSEPMRSPNGISADFPMTVSSHHGPLQHVHSLAVSQAQRRERFPASQKDTDDVPEPTFRAKKMKFVQKSPLRDVETSTDLFSAAGSLKSYLDLRGGKFKKQILLGLGSKAKHDTLGITEEMDTDPILISQGTYPSRGDGCPPLARSGSLRQPNEHIEVPSTPNGEATFDSSPPLPVLTHLDGQRTVIVDSALVNNRQLLSFAERQGRNLLTIIYRDLHRKPDVILDPKTCIVYTNFQALTQRSLPGQMPKMCTSTPQEVIKHLAVEFESIYVLVSISASTKVPVSDSQVNTMAGFSSFCASLKSGSPSARVVPLWIPVEDSPADHFGNSSSLCRWTWSLICRHAFRNVPKPNDLGKEEQLGITQEETLWELFLRKAGMNAMAAQVILGKLKRPDQPGREGTHAQEMSTSEKTWGLGKFVSMPAEERLVIFSRLVGVSAIEQINKVLE